ncbi:5-formyltetrahydrofolate cyclo-ligase [Microvirga lotononidis]|uniref:5-formyltetrahydrofolate cyclo-ligase n=1 Tax=Microvirga lotononidis TaxID=864069 RepID=I4YTT8_9HYPH|nr:5-formyltetrahydrofolate cyclo-ligase [Microvirga lotononidis]EIM27380.1 5,10-methenyltetrahydrofolate synthetase [Microvirga lotononidis]WQO28451.1 5-formyltetrahydrofolate cyclo-ligase [Microvirga lotononidis]
MQSPPPPALKERLRGEVLSRRDALDKDFRHEAGRRIAESALGFPDLKDVTPIGGYWPIRSEVDPRPLMEALIGRGQDVALSQILHPHLSWRLWQPGDVLVKGGFGVREPGPDAPEVFPKALIVPLVAFDCRGGRIGYGKGHFDRAIAALEAQHPVLTIGLAYAVQEIDEVPVEPHDRLLDVIITEAELIRTVS